MLSEVETSLHHGIMRSLDYARDDKAEKCFAPTTDYHYRAKDFLPLLTTNR